MRNNGFGFFFFLLYLFILILVKRNNGFGVIKLKQHNFNLKQCINSQSYNMYHQIMVQRL